MTKNLWNNGWEWFIVSVLGCTVPFYDAQGYLKLISIGYQLNFYRFEIAAVFVYPVFGI